MRLCVIATTTVLTLAITESRAADGNKLLEWCKETPVMTMSYVTGITDAYAVAGAPFKYCPPEEVTYGQVRDVTCKWLENHPEDRHVSGSMLVPLALSKAWPCP